MLRDGPALAIPMTGMVKLARQHAFRGRSENSTAYSQGWATLNVCLGNVDAR